jgi:phytoene dehydrogenase-like protein
MESVTDTVVIGAGPNGLVAANLLADAGWSVLVLEAADRPGGAVKSDRDVHQDYVHDTFSAFYPLAAVSPAIRALRLEDHGLAWVHAPAVLGNPIPGGPWALLHRDRELTAASVGAAAAGDRAAWLQLCRDWDKVGPALTETVLGPFPPVRAAAASALALLRTRGVPGLGLPLVPIRRLVEARFAGDAAAMLLTGNAMHADIGPGEVGSGLIGLLLTMLGQTGGFPVPRGGAGELTAALVRRLESRGGSVQTDALVESVVIHRGHAVGARLRDGTVVDARRAVVADVSAPALFGRLVARENLPRRIRVGMRRFRWDPATVKVDWALSSPVPWDPAPAVAPGTVHLALSTEELAAYYEQLRHGLVPSHPFLLVGQMTTADPTRSPAGTESLWAYAHVPQTVRGDAGAVDGPAIRGRWDASERERMANRMQARIERFAPGFGDRVRARRVLGPLELEAADANLEGGAINGGTARLRQQLVLRPVPGLAGARTGIPGLYLASASAHPGGGVHGSAGANAARAALRDMPVRRWPTRARHAPTA